MPLNTSSPKIPLEAPAVKGLASSDSLLDDETKRDRDFVYPVSRQRSGISFEDYQAGDTPTSALKTAEKVGRFSCRPSKLDGDKFDEMKPREVFKYPILERKSFEKLDSGVLTLCGAQDGMVRPPPARKDLVTCYEWIIAKTDSATSSAFGVRDIKADGSFSDLSWNTRFDFQNDYLRYANGIKQELNALCPEETFDDMGMVFPTEKVATKEGCPEDVSTMRIMGTSMMNRYEFIVMEYAAQLLGITLVPLYATLGADAIDAVIEETRMTTILGDIPTVANMLKAFETEGETCSHRPTTFILTHGPADKDAWSAYKGQEVQERAEALGITVRFWSEFKSEQSLPIADRHQWHEENIWTISYTSGTTGRPKGVMLSQRALMNGTFDIQTAYCEDKGLFDIGDYFPTYFSYLPLAHILERICLATMTIVGFRCAFHSGNLITLVDEIKKSEATVLQSVPRVLERIVMKVEAAMAAKPFPIRMLFEKALSAKIANRKQTGDVKSSLWDTLIMSKVKNEVLGPQMNTFICGGAPLATEVRDTIQAIFSCPVLIGYGLTETCGAVFIQHSRDVNNTIGWPTRSSEAKLKDCPDLGRFEKDGTGEVLLKGYSVFSGYFRQPEKTAEILTEDGWFCTGDVAVIDEYHGAAIVDRVKNCFKLCQGEYIAPERVENFLKTAASVDQIIVTGTSTETCCVAMVTLNETLAIQHGKALSELVNDAVIQGLVIEEIRAKAKEGGLKGFEVPKYFAFVQRTIMPDDGFHTPTLKVKRPVFNNRCATLIQHLYTTKASCAIRIDTYLANTDDIQSALC